MVLIEQKKRSLLAPLFAGWEETLIDSCIQGYMGEAFADCEEMPQSALICVGDFAFFAGIPNIEALRKAEEYKNTSLIFVPQHQGWERLIETEVSNIKKIVRYAIKKEKDVFDKAHLNKLADTLPEGIQIQKIDAHYYEKCLAEEWSQDFVSVFQSREEFLEKGLGFVAVLDGEIVSGASSYSVYQDGIEIEVDTKPAFRQQGLAGACAARLILECLERAWYPSWDAATRISVELAKKLGYHFDKEYTAYVKELL